MKSNYEISSFDLKLGLLEYFRFKKGFVVSEECMNNDVLVDTGKEIIEIEVKISKQDLLRERNKMLDRCKKHDYYANARAKHWLIPNRFYFCVPTFLVNDAVELCNELNKSYGVIEFDENKLIDKPKISMYNAHEQCIKIVKKTKVLHDRYSEKYSHVIALRSSTKMISLMKDIYRRK